MPLSGSHAFDPQLPPGFTADKITDSVARIATLQEAHYVQHISGRHYQITVNTGTATMTLLQFKNVHLSDQVVPLLPVGLVSTSVACLFLPSPVRDKTLTKL